MMSYTRARYPYTGTCYYIGIGSLLHTSIRRSRVTGDYGGYRRLIAYLAVFGREGDVRPCVEKGLYRPLNFKVKGSLILDIGSGMLERNFPSQVLVYIISKH
jgi:hypothetical protein